MFLVENIAGTIFSDFYWILFRIVQNVFRNENLNFKNFLLESFLGYLAVFSKNGDHMLKNGKKDFLSKSGEWHKHILLYKIFSKSGELSLDILLGKILFVDIVLYLILFKSGELYTNMFLWFSWNHGNCSPTCFNELFCLN